MNEQTLPGDLALSRKAAVRARTGAFRNSNVHRWLRTFHRASALIFGLFMAVVGITGALIALEMLLGPGAHGGQGVFSSTVHFTIMDLHTFFIFGKSPGLVVELLVGPALVLFSVSGVWFYAALFRQWLKLATKEIGGYAPSSAFRAANRFMARFAVVLMAVVLILAIILFVDWIVARPASMAAQAAHLPPPPPNLADATKTFLSLKADVILMVAGGFAVIYFCVVGFWYSGLVFAGWRLSKAKRAASPAEPAKAMRTIHRWLSVPFGLYLIVIAITGLALIPGLWGAGFLPFLSSPNHLRNLKTEAMEARNRALPPELRAQANPMPNMGPGGAMPAMGPGGAMPTMRPGGGMPAMGPGGAMPAMGPGGAMPTMRPGGGMPAMGPGGAMPAMGPGGAMPTMSPGGAMVLPPDFLTAMLAKFPLYGRLSEVLKDVHNGAVFGKGGQIFVLLTGLALAMFSLSGIWMYVSMYFPRRESGRKALFWH